MHLPRWLVVAGAEPFYRLGLNARVHPRLGRPVLDSIALAMRPPKDLVLTHETLGGRPVERTTVGTPPGKRAVLYLHGGGYTVGSPRLFRNTAAHLAQAADSVGYNLDYRMAPEDPYPAALDDAVAAVRALIHDGYAPAQIAIAGDSAGGGLAVAAARVLADSGVHVAALGLISPWTQIVDPTVALRHSRGNDSRWGTAAGRMYRGTAALEDPGHSPMYGPLGGLPPMLIHVGSNELLHDQVLRFADKVRAAGTEVTVDENPRWWHSFHVATGTLRDATDAVEQMGRFLRTHLDGAPASSPAATRGARSS